MLKSGGKWRKEWKRDQDNRGGTHEKPQRKKEGKGEKAGKQKKRTRRKKSKFNETSSSLLFLPFLFSSFIPLYMLFASNQQLQYEEAEARAIQHTNGTRLIKGSAYRVAGILPDEQRKEKERKELQEKRRKTRKQKLKHDKHDG